MREAELKNKQSKSSPWITSIGNINFLFCLVLAIIIFLVILFILILENYYIKPSSAEEKTNFLSMVGGLLGGGSLLFGVYFAWKQLQVAFDGMITDRISQAVEHIGSEDLSVKLGGIYSLERIALDSDRDLPKIIEILCAYIRVHSPSEVIDREWHVLANAKELTDDELSEIIDDKFNRPRLNEDIQVALQIVANLTILDKDPKKRSYFVSRNLFGINIKGTRFPKEADLSYFFIDNSQLDYIVVSAGSKLVNSRISNTDMRGATLEGVDLSHSELSGSAMELTRFRKATLTKARLLNSRLACANFIEASAEEANFNQAKLRRASFSKAILRKANFGFTDLREAILEEADLREVSFASANLSKAEFKDAKINGANLYKANLKDAQELTEEQLAKATLCQTILPNGSISNRDCKRLGISPNGESSQ